VGARPRGIPMRGSCPVDNKIHGAIDGGPEFDVWVILRHLNSRFDLVNGIGPCIPHSWGDQGNNAVAE